MHDYSVLKSESTGEYVIFNNTREVCRSRSYLGVIHVLTSLELTKPRKESSDSYSAVWDNSARRVNGAIVGKV